MLTTKQKYDDIFEKERKNNYPEVDDFENRRAIAVDRVQLESAARVLACPLKVNPPHWQHGRVIYATAVERLLHGDDEGIFLDIGTAKGFSACVMSWAIGTYGKKNRRIVSIDVIDPGSKDPRNSVAEIDNPMTIFQFVAPFKHPDVEMTFIGWGSKAWLAPNPLRIAYAFIDGKHTYEAVSYEAFKISQRQQKGDVIVFDDLQIAPIGRAVSELRGYDMQYLTAGPRRYAIAVKK